MTVSLQLLINFVAVFSSILQVNCVLVELDAVYGPVAERKAESDRASWQCDHLGIRPRGIRRIVAFLVINPVSALRASSNAGMIRMDTRKVRAWICNSASEVLAGRYETFPIQASITIE
jgi:hypothetical protein